MERIINTRLNWLLETSNIIANEQAGFRSHRSTSEHIVKLSHFIKDALDNKHILTAVFVDFKSAYYSVWKENLLLKLIRSGIRSNLLHWLEFISYRAVLYVITSTQTHYSHMVLFTSHHRECRYL